MYIRSITPFCMWWYTDFEIRDPYASVFALSKKTSAFRCMLGYEIAKIIIINLYIYAYLWIKIDFWQGNQKFGVRINTWVLYIVYIFIMSISKTFNAKKLSVRYRAYTKAKHKLACLASFAIQSGYSFNKPNLTPY